jgi:hypothetical protein
MNSFLKWGHKIGLFFVLWTIICVAWYYVLPFGAERMLYIQLFRLSFFDISGASWTSVLSAIVQSYIFGYVAVGTWVAAEWLACPGKKCK